MYLLHRLRWNRKFEEEAEEQEADFTRQFEARHAVSAMLIDGVLAFFTYYINLVAPVLNLNFRHFPVPRKKVLC